MDERRQSIKTHPSAFPNQIGGTSECGLLDLHRLRKYVRASSCCWDSSLVWFVGSSSSKISRTSSLYELSCTSLSVKCSPSRSSSWNSININVQDLFQFTHDHLVRSQVSGYAESADFWKLNSAHWIQFETKSIHFWARWLKSPTALFCFGDMCVDYVSKFWI